MTILPTSNLNMNMQCDDADKNQPVKQLFYDDTQSRTKAVALDALLAGSLFFISYAVCSFIVGSISLGVVSALTGVALHILGISLFHSKSTHKVDRANDLKILEGIEKAINGFGDEFEINQAISDVLKKYSLRNTQVRIANHSDIYGHYLLFSGDEMSDELYSKILKLCLDNHNFNIVEFHFNKSTIDSSFWGALQGNSSLIWLKLDGVKDFCWNAFKNMLNTTSIAEISFLRTAVEKKWIDYFKERYSIKIDDDKVNYYILKGAFRYELENILRAQDNFGENIYILSKKYRPILKMMTIWYIEPLRNIRDDNCIKLIDCFKDFCPNIKQISFSDCVNISDKTIKYLLSQNFKLKQVDLSGCVGVTMSALNYFIPMLRYLQQVDLNGCCMSSVYVQRFFEDNRQHLKNKFKVNLPSGEEIILYPKV